MYYKSFSITNYKGIKERLEFNLDVNAEVPHCIIGNNESGKTTILKAIELIGRLCQGDILQNGARKAIKPKGDYFSGSVELGAEMQLNINLISKEINLAKYVSDAKQDITSLTFKFFYEFENSSYKNNSNEIRLHNSLVTEEKDKQVIFELIKKSAPDIIYYDDFKFAVPKSIRFLETGQEANNSLQNTDDNRHWQTIFSDILKGNDPKANSFQSDIVDWYRDANNDPSIADSRLRNMGKYLDFILQEWINKKDNLIERFEVSKKQPEKPEDSSYNDYQIRVISGKNSYEMHERSKGLQWSFCFHILTRIRQNRSDKGFIFLLDEPANNLHIKPQHEMLLHLKELCTNNSTVIYSTHSPELIGVDKKNYAKTFIAKNNATEFADTNIHLYKLIGSTGDIDVQDVEPILAKLAYKDLNLFCNEVSTDKSLSIRAKLDNLIKKCTSYKGDKIIEKLANISTVGDFIMNIFK